MSAGLLELGSDKVWQSLRTQVLRLVPGVRFFPRRDRGIAWWALEQTDGDLFYRLDALSYQFLQQLDGEQTVEQLWQRLDPPGWPKQALCGLLLQLLKAGVLQSAQTDATTLETVAPARKVFNPVGFQLFSFNPAWLLQPIRGCAPFIFNKICLLAWLGLMLFGLVMLIENYTPLRVYLAARADDTLYLLWLWGLYPLVKLVHEVAHGLAVMRWGAEVRKAGILMLVLMPVPFVDASASSRFRAKSQRITVAAAGVMAELSLAVLGLGLWVYSESPPLREAGLIVALIGSFSTLLFNANPLLRFDGYYMLSDWIEIPNLATRSQAYIKHWLGRVVLGLQGPQPPQYLPTERKWLAGYGVLAFAYRLFILFTIALLVSSYLLWLGVLIALWAVVLQLLVPAVKLLHGYYRAAKAEARLTRFYLCLLSLVAAISLLLFAPFNRSLVAEGVVVLDKHAYLRAEAAGFVTQVFHRNGDQVAAGDALLQLENDQLRADLARLETDIVAVEALRTNLFVSDPEHASQLGDELSELQVQREELARQVENLTVRAARTGTLSIDAVQDLPGRFIQKGQPLGYVYRLDRVEVQTVLSPKQVQTLRHNNTKAWVKFYSDPEQTVRAAQIVAVPKAIDRLPDSSLGSRHGGGIRVSTQDEAGKQLLQPMFQFNLLLPIRTEQRYIGKTVSIRFEHASESLYRRLLNWGWDVWQTRAYY